MNLGFPIGLNLVGYFLQQRKTAIVYLATYNSGLSLLCLQPSALLHKLVGADALGGLDDQQVATLGLGGGGELHAGGVLGYVL